MHRAGRQHSGFYLSPHARYAVSRQHSRTLHYMGDAATLPALRVSPPPQKARNTLYPNSRPTTSTMLPVHTDISLLVGRFNCLFCTHVFAPFHRFDRHFFASVPRRRWRNLSAPTRGWAGAGWRGKRLAASRGPAAPSWAGHSVLGIRYLFSS